MSRVGQGSGVRLTCRSYTEASVGMWRAEAPADLTLHHLRAFSNSSERQSTRCFRIPGGQVNLGVPNLSLSFFGEDNRWNRFTEG